MLFLAAAICFRQQLEHERQARKNTSGLYEYSLFGGGHAERGVPRGGDFSRGTFLTGRSFVAEVCKTASYVVILCGALLEQARLFEQVHSMAVSDSLTGLANYRRLIHVLETELDRSKRTRRRFSVMLLDMDGLKAINDQFGHLTGSRALVRLGKSFSNHSGRSIRRRVTAATSSRWCCRKRGAIVATRVVARIREKLAAEPERPALSVSAGVASFPEDGDTPEQLAGRGGSRAVRHEASRRQRQHSKSQANRGVPVRMTTAMPLKKHISVFTAMNAGSRWKFRWCSTGIADTPGSESTFTENVSARGARVVSTRRWEKGEP